MDGGGRPEMKLLLVSDLHYSLRQLDWVQNVADRYQVVVLAGDHIDVSSSVAFEAQIVVILKYLQRIGSRARLVVSSGNHDLNSTNAAGEKVAAWMSRVRRIGAATDGDTLEVDDTLFTVCPWWDGPVSRAEVDAQLARDAAARAGRRWIWVYHSPPAHSPTSWTGSKHFGDDDLVEWMSRHRPDVVLAGHVHQSPFRQGGSWVDRIGDTWVFNAGREMSSVPCHIVIEPGAGRASWFSSAGTELVDLADASARRL
jgi:Icc-related predicted phosphoesterase